MKEIVSRMERHGVERMDIQTYRDLWISHFLERAIKIDYTQWLKGVIQSGSEPTHYYDYPMARVLDKFYVAIRHFRVAPLYGSSSIAIIVPNGIDFLGGELGHSNLYFMKDFKNIGGWIPVFEDTQSLGDKELDSRIREFIRKEKEESRNVELNMLQKVRAERERWKTFAKEEIGIDDKTLEEILSQKITR